MIVRFMVTMSQVAADSLALESTEITAALREAFSLDEDEVAVEELDTPNEGS